MRPNQEGKRSGFNKLVGAGDGNRTHVRSLGSLQFNSKNAGLAAFLQFSERLNWKIMENRKRRSASAGRKDPHRGGPETLLGRTRASGLGFTDLTVPNQTPLEQCCQAETATARSKCEDSSLRHTLGCQGTGRMQQVFVRSNKKRMAGYEAPVEYRYCILKKCNTFRKSP